MTALVHTVDVTETPEGHRIVATCPDPRVCDAGMDGVCQFVDQVNAHGEDALDDVSVSAGLSILDVIHKESGTQRPDGLLRPGRYEISGVGVDGWTGVSGTWHSFLVASGDVSYYRDAIDTDEAWVREQAMGALGWLTGYTDPGPDEIQYKIDDVSLADDRLMMIEVRPADRYRNPDRPTRRFTIDVVVRKVPSEPPTSEPPPEHPDSLLETLDQDYWWRAQDEGWVSVESMMLSHKRNLAAWLLRNAPTLLGKIINHLKRQSWSIATGPQPSGEMASDSVDQIMDEIMQTETELRDVLKQGKAAEWMRTTALYRRLVADSDRGGQVR